MKSILDIYLLTYLLLKHIHTYLLTYLLPHSMEQSVSSQLVNCTAFYETQRFITTFTRAHHLSLSWPRSILSMPTHHTSWRPIL